MKIPKETIIHVEEDGTKKSTLVVQIQGNPKSLTVMLARAMEKSSELREVIMNSMNLLRAHLEHDHNEEDQEDISKLLKKYRKDKVKKREIN